MSGIKTGEGCVVSRKHKRGKPQFPLHLRTQKWETTRTIFSRWYGDRPDMKPLLQLSLHF